MSIDAVGSSAQASQQTQSALSKTTNVGKDEFIKLLVAQLKNQDPLNPMDNQQFVAQLATFSSLEQLISINEGVSKLVDSNGANSSTTNL